MHEVPETGVQDSVAEPVQWAREEEEEPGGSRREEEEEEEEERIVPPSKEQGAQFSSATIKPKVGER